jgi:hypothetical protein
MRRARCLQAEASSIYFCACSRPRGGFEVPLAQSQEVNRRDLKHGRGAAYLKHGRGAEFVNLRGELSPPAGHNMSHLNPSMLLRKKSQAKTSSITKQPPSPPDGCVLLCSA